MTTDSAAGSLVVVGDSLLDQDWHGSVTRLAPDAPVPVVDLDQEWERPGGAALTAVFAAELAQAYGLSVVLVTALADDDAGRRLAALLAGRVGLRVLPLAGRTACKTRIRGSGLPMLRLDSGDGIAAAQPLPAELAGLIAGAGAVLVSDYGRGVTGLPGLADALRSTSAPVIWDPHPRGSAPVAGCTLVTPNAAEAQALAATTDGCLLLERWSAAAVAVTVGSEGARLATPTGSVAIEVPGDLGCLDASADTCGAGDRLAAAAAVELLRGASVQDAVRAGVREAATYVLAGGAGAVSSRC